jgi:hypothetical protein
MSIITNQAKVVDGANSNRARAPAKTATGKFSDQVWKADQQAQAKHPTLAAAVPGAGWLVMKRGGLTAVLPTVDGGARAYCLKIFKAWRLTPVTPPVRNVKCAQCAHAAEHLLN